jgi:hypothetical protein
MIQTQQVGIPIIMIGVAAVLMVVTGPTFENQQAIAASQPMIKKVSLKDPPTKAKKDPPRKRFRCALWRGKRCVRWVPVHFRGPAFRHPGIRPPVGSVRPPMGSVRPPAGGGGPSGIRPPIGSVRPGGS